MMMIIEIGLCKTCIKSFFIKKTITSWLSWLTITNCHLVNIYAPKWPFLTIMCQNDSSLGSFFFIIFLAMAMTIIVARAMMMSIASFSFFLMFLLQCSHVASLTCFELVGDTKVFFVDMMLLWKRDSKLWQWKIMAKELEDKDL